MLALNRLHRFDGFYLQPVRSECKSTCLLSLPIILKLKLLYFTDRTNAFDSQSAQVQIVSIENQVQSGCARRVALFVFVVGAHQLLAIGIRAALWSDDEQRVQWVLFESNWERVQMHDRFRDQSQVQNHHHTVQLLRALVRHNSHLFEDISHHCEAIAFRVRLVQMCSRHAKEPNTIRVDQTLRVPIHNFEHEWRAHILLDTA